MKLSAYLPQASDSQWAAGCEHCHYGIVSAPDLTGAVSLYLERLVQAISKQLVFCECQAGTRLHSNLLNVRQKLIEEARRDPRMADFAKRLTHPDIECAQRLITESYLFAPAPTMHMEQAKRVPTVHGAGEQVTA
jgi:hypothetical protein